MIPRIALITAALGLAGFVLWHPARAPMVASSTAPPAAAPSFQAGTGVRPRHRGLHRYASGDDVLVVYVAGAVKRPGLYQLRPGDRDAHAVALAGGFGGSADAAGVNLAQRAQDGDEIYVPAAGEARHQHSPSRRSHRRSARPPPDASLDVNGSNASELAAVPGIGRAIAQRIVELREREGAFNSLDELLDVAGMTESRLERARPYLREP